MRLWMLTKLLAIPPVVIDGALWCLVALFMTQQQMLTGEEAYKYCNPKVLFWMKYVIASLGSMVGSLKAFRSTSYAQHLQNRSADKPLPSSP